MNTLKLLRTDHCDNQTLGKLFVLDQDDKILFECQTLELPWKDNERLVSCIPAGTYPIRPRWSKKYGHHLELLDVPDRSLILIHEANYHRQLLGCIAVGRNRMDIDGDGHTDITHSIVTKNQLITYVDDQTTITIQ